MKGRYVSRFLLHRSAASLSSLVESSNIKISAGAAVTRCFTTRGTVVGESSSYCDYLAPSQFFPGHCIPQDSRRHAARESLDCQRYLFSSRSNTSRLLSRPSCKETSTFQRKWFADDALKHEEPRCWSCQQQMSSGSGLLCPSCNAIQPVNPSIDYYQIFDLSRSFKLDLRVLEQRYKNLQKKLHPDLAGSKSQVEQGYSADQSAYVIQGYYILLRPLSRARYLLGLHGIKVEEEGTIDDPDLLMEIMEIRESIEAVSDPLELKQAQAQNNNRILECEKALESAFVDEDLERGVRSVQRLAYYIKVGEEILRKL